MKKCRLVMDSGKEYIFEGTIEELCAKICTQESGDLVGGDLIDGVVFMDGVAINPTHISSVEYSDLDAETPRKIK